MDLGNSSSKKKQVKSVPTISNDPSPVRKKKMKRKSSLSSSNKSKRTKTTETPEEKALNDSEKIHAFRTLSRYTRW